MQAEVLVPAARYTLPKQPSSSQSAGPSQLLSRNVTHPISDLNRDNAKDLGLTEVQLDLLTSTDDRHILNAQCANCAKRNLDCVKRWRLRACQPCADKRMRCPISSEMGAYWGDVTPRARSRSRSRTPSIGRGYRKLPSRATTPPPSTTASRGPSSGADAGKYPHMLQKTNTII